MLTLSQLATPVAQGRTAEIYAWDATHILKLYRDWCPRHWVDYESRVAHAIVAAGIPTPAAGEIIEIEGRRGIIYERVRAYSMLQDMQACPWRLWRHARALAELQAQVHRLVVPGLPRYRDELAHAISHATTLPESLRRLVLERLVTLPDGDTLCHGDLHPDNVLLTERGPLIIDWMTAVSGSPWADVARTSMILSIGGRAADKRQVPFYLHWFALFFCQAYLRHYHALNPDQQEEFPRWAPVIAAARLAEEIKPEREALIAMVQDGVRWQGS
ncbi:MAG: phosphotransferase [Anaerolineae bacterium]|nr:phosphotransferase [Anaerolineae bacterium]